MDELADEDFASVVVGCFRASALATCCAPVAPALVAVAVLVVPLSPHDASKDIPAAITAA